ncbi:MAG: thioredoxin [Candidatus Doudnabacteria bacterium]|nr:thioredoxin [Candidatus Doudnabacteria bacterium]
MAKANFSELIQGSTPTLVDFSAEWCGPCKMMAPILDEVKAAMNDSIRIIKIDVDKNPSMAESYQIRGVPTLILFQQGQIKWRQSGVVPTEQLKKVIQSFA